MTAAAILDACNPSLSDALLVELLTKLHVSPEEAREISTIVEAWGEEPNNGMTREERHAEIRGRVLAFLESARAPYRCHRCGAPLPRVFMIDANDNELCAKCSTPAVKCEHCPEMCPPDDRTPTKAGGFAHARCATRVSVALGGELSALLNGRGLGVMRGGRS